MGYSVKIAKLVKHFLDEDSWNYDFDEEKGTFHFNLTLKGKLQKISYHVMVRQFDFSVYAVCPISADECKAQMAEFVSRVNYGLVNGNFELDFRDGEIRYKCFVNCDGTDPGKQIIKDSIYIPAQMFKRYGDGILAVIFEMKTPEQAAQDCKAAP